LKRRNTYRKKNRHWAVFAGFQADDHIGQGSKSNRENNLGVGEGPDFIYAFVCNSMQF